MDDDAKVSIATLASLLTYLQEANKRLARLLALSLILLAGVFSCLLFVLTK